ncbi:ABC transporter substrate-binding protein [Candidatus Aerophobetes bacterium]|nr:ABC transporter substrate-binding protein [Candidatus Aerophobetes bacterium]
MGFIRAKKRLIIALLVAILGIAGSWFGWNWWASQKEKEVVFFQEMVDDFGEKVTVSKKPEKIVSLSPSNTEILFAIGAGDKVVGVTEYCDFPLEVLKVDKVGGFSTPNIEAIVAKSPDLVVAAYRTGEENIQRLKELGLTVIALHPESLQDVLGNITLVGKATGYEEDAEKLVKRLQEKINLIKEKSESIPEEKRPRVLWLMWYPELWTAGDETFFHELLLIAGGKNIAHDLKGWKIISREIVLARNPQIILCSSMGGKQSFLPQFLNDSQLAHTEAVKKGQIYELDPNTIERPGPRIVDGLEAISSYILETGG